jgi:hypothetical protein
MGDKGKKKFYDIAYEKISLRAFWTSKIYSHELQGLLLQNILQQ